MEGDLKLEGEQQAHSREPAPHESEPPRKQISKKVRLRRAAASIGTVQQRTDEAAWQDPGGLAQIGSERGSGPASGAAGGEWKSPDGSLAPADRGGPSGPPECGGP